MGKYLNRKKFKLHSSLPVGDLYRSIFSLAGGKSKVYQQPHHPNVFEIRSTEVLWWVSPPSSKYLIDLRLIDLTDGRELHASIRGNWVMNFTGIVFLIALPLMIISFIMAGEGLLFVFSMASTVFGMIRVIIYINMQYREEGISEFLNLKKRVRKLESELEIKN